MAKNKYQGRVGRPHKGSIPSQLGEQADNGCTGKCRSACALINKVCVSGGTCETYSPTTPIAQNQSDESEQFQN